MVSSCGLSRVLLRHQESCCDGSIVILPSLIGGIMYGGGNNNRMRGAALMGLTGNAGPSSRSTPSASSQYNSSFALGGDQAGSHHTATTDRAAGITSGRDAERSGVLSLGGGAIGGGASYDRRGASTGTYGSSAGGAGRYGRESERSGVLPLDGGVGGASYDRRGASMGTYGASAGGAGRYGRESERSGVLPLDGGVGGASYDRRGASMGTYGTSAGDALATGLYSRESERSGVLPLGGAVGGASYDRRGASTGTNGTNGAPTAGGFATGPGRDFERSGATSVAAAGRGGGGSSRAVRRELVRGNVGVAEEANVKYRPSMEDRYVICNPLPTGGGVFLGVFDGHGGSGAADFAAEVIQHNFTNELKRAERNNASLNITEIMTNTYHETDSQIAMAGVSRSAGCTAVCAYLQVDSQGRRMLHVANAGDSRAVLCRNITSSGSASNNIESLTRDHKPSDPQEQARIEAAGGNVVRGRVMGMLAVSRALGDHSLKDFVVSTPDVRSTELGVNDEGFLLLACDGVFDVYTNEEAVAIVQSCYRARQSEQQSDLNISTLLARDLVERSIQNGSRDNVTCLVCLV